MTRGARIRVLVVDDSAFARRVVRQLLERHPSIEVVGIARDGLEALESIQALQPDVVTLDLVMPNLDGLGVLRALPAGGPRVVVVSITDRDADRGIEALEAGAMELVQKPTALATERLYEMGDELVCKVLAAAEARMPVPGDWVAVPVERVVVRDPQRHRIVVIGASTGGPQALSRLLPRLPGELPAAVAVALHIPAGYTDALARRLDRASAIQVREAETGMELAPGHALIARGGSHLELEDGFCRVLDARTQKPSVYCPSVDRLFRSAAREYGSATLAVVLTGMGDDGLLGARAIHEAGGTVLAESESSCIVYGMPRVVHDAGLTSGVAPIDGMADTILEWL